MADAPTATMRRKHAVLQRVSASAPTDNDDGPGPEFVAVPAVVPAAPVRRAATGLDPLGGTQAEPEIVSALDRMRGKGSRLPTPVAQPLGDALGADFGDVRIHADPASHSMATALQARAFTHGSDIYFSAGSYAPHTTAGHHLLSHELAHVVQSRSETGSGSGTVVGRADDHAEVQAESTAHRISRMFSGLSPMSAVPVAGPRQGGSRIARMIRRAGDKLAFEAKKVEAGEDQQLVDKIKAAIEAHQLTKRTYKNTIEKDKDDKIGKIDAKFQPILTGDEKTDFPVIEKAKGEKVVELKAFHQSYQTSGWKLDKLKQEILVATGGKVEIGPENDGEIAITNKKGEKLYSIFKGSKRFGEQITEEDGKPLVNPARTRIGTTKQYVQDVNDLYIGRFVYRGCSGEQMKEMFNSGTMKPRYDIDTIGRQAKTYDFGNDSSGTKRTRNSKISEAERAFLQQRDGSGDEQRMLSATHAKGTRKVYSNHGEEFRGDETDSAVIKIDLARIDKALIVDVHLPESHTTKVGLPQKRDLKTEGRKKNAANRKTPEQLAAKEKGLYIYSSERNRESLLRRIPEAAVVAVTVKDSKTALGFEAAKRLYNPTYKLQQEQKEAKEQAAKEQEEKLKLATASTAVEGSEVKKDSS